MITKWLKAYSKIAVYICGALIFISVLLITLEVLLRKFFAVSFGGVDEISGYMLGICISWSLAYVLYEKMHIRIDVLYDKLRNKSKAYLDLLSMAFTLLFISFLSYYAGLVAFTSIEKSSVANTPLGTPLWIPQTSWFLGFVFFLIVILTLFIKALVAVVKGTNDEDVSIGKEF